MCLLIVYLERKWMTYGRGVANKSYHEFIRLGWEVLSVGLVVLDDALFPENEMHRAFVRIGLHMESSIPILSC
jgi:hypothetical protein